MKKTKLLTLMLLSASLLSGCGGTKEVDNTNQLNLDRLDLLMNPLGDGSYDVVATVTPSYATNKELTWELLWDADDASETDDDAWKEGKTITDYITKTISEDTFTANIKNVAAFASQAKLKASVTAKPSVNASVTINYRKKNIVKHDNNKFVLMTPSSDSNMTVPYYVGDSIGSLPRTETQNVTYQYADYFVWRGGAMTSTVTWSALIPCSGDGGSTSDLLGALAANFATKTTRTVSNSVFYGVLSGASQYNVFEDFVYAMKSHSSGDAYRSQGGQVHIPYKMFLNGEQVYPASASQWAYVQFDHSQVSVSPQGVSFNPGSIEF